MSSKFTCGSIIPSSCVPFTGKDLKFLPAGQLACDSNVDDVIDLISIAIDDLKKATDVSTHSSSTISLSSPKTVKSVLQDHATKIDAMSALLGALQTQVAQIDISSELININLGCLSPAAAACQVSTNNYTLVSILTLFKNEICAIKTHLGI